MNAPARILATPERVRLTVESYLLLDEHGAFADYTKTELIDGDVYGMNAQYSRHARVKTRLSHALAYRLSELGSDLEAVVGVAVRVADDSVPEPDIVLTRWRGEGVVPVETVALIVEVADTTLATDLGRKAKLYAAAGVPEYWVIDLNGARVVRHDEPGTAGYAGWVEVALGERLVSVTLPGIEVESAALVV